LDEAIAFIEREQSGYGLLFYDALEVRFERLLTYPRMGKRVGPNVRRLVMRAWRHSIIYSIEPHYLWVLAIAHQSRRKNYWRHRLRDNRAP
jgi:plasmid stabilization system protein ParE